MALPAPNFCQVHLDFVDDMAKYSGEALKVFVALSLTQGTWNDVPDGIEPDKISELTGLSLEQIEQASSEVPDNLIVRKENGNYDIPFHRPSPAERYGIDDEFK